MAKAIDRGAGVSAGGTDGVEAAAAAAAAAAARSRVVFVLRWRIN